MQYPMIMMLKIPGEEPLIHSMNRFMPTDCKGAVAVSHAFFSSSDWLVDFLRLSTVPDDSSSVIRNPMGSGSVCFPALLPSKFGKSQVVVRNVAMASQAHNPKAGNRF